MDAIKQALQRKKPQAEMKAWNPGWIDTARHTAQGMLSPLLFGGDDRKAMAYIDDKKDTLDWAPVAGEVKSGAESIDEYNKGNYGMAGLLAVGAIPFVGMPARAAAKGIKKGIKAYHGSPHSFDKFSMDAIGTGEGAQAYGHGLYFAENEKVAKQYRDELLPAGIPDVNKRLKEVSDEMNKISTGYRNWKPGNEETGKRLAKEYDDLMDARAGMKGSMYEVNINADPEDFLDWDKPLSEQSAKVQEYANARRDKILPGRDIANMDGNMLMKMSSPQADIDGREWLEIGPAADASRRLREAGIPGIKYLDQGSRQAGDGSRNYVVFDDSMVEILRKYGIVPAGMSAAMLTQSLKDDPEKAQELAAMAGGGA